LKRLAALLLALPSPYSGAATAYVTDQLVLGVYSQQNQQGQHLATLHSGAGVEVLAANGDYSQVRLGDGTTGWVKSTYLTTQLPATAQIEQLQALAAKQAELDALRGPPEAGSIRHPYRTLLAVALALGLGFWLGYVTLARRVRHKFGGIKVY